MDSSQAYEIAREAVEQLAQEKGKDATFPFDAIWNYVPNGADVPSLLRPAQANRLRRDGYIERTGKAIAAQSKSRAGNQTAEYKLGIRFQQNLQQTETPASLRLEGLHVTNYRVLQNIKIDRVTPLAAFVGANGSGKSTIFDVISFLSDCFTFGVERALQARGGFRELRSKGSTDGAITFKVMYREASGTRLKYELAIYEDSNYDPHVEEELLTEVGETNPPLLSFHEGAGGYVDEQNPKKRYTEAFQEPYVLAVSALGQRFPRIAALHSFITDWYLSSVRIDRIRIGSEFGRTDQLSITGDNLAQVIRQMEEQEPNQLKQLMDKLAQWIPMLDKIETETGTEGRLLLQLRDHPFKKPIPAQFVSEGTLKMLAYLTVLYSTHTPQLIGLEEPENFLNPRLLRELAETCRAVAEQPQLLVTTHSPFFVNSLQPEEVWVLNRNSSGYTQVQRAADILGIPEFMKHGAQLGDLWMEGHFRTAKK